MSSAVIDYPREACQTIPNTIPVCRLPYAALKYAAATNTNLAWNSLEVLGMNLLCKVYSASTRITIPTSYSEQLPRAAIHLPQ